MTEKRFEYSDVYGWQTGAFLKVMNGLDRKNNELNERIKQQEELISEQAIQLDYLQDENKHMKDVLNENKQLKEFINKIADDNGDIVLINGYGYNIKTVIKND